MKPFFRFIAAIACLLLIAAAAIYHQGGKQMEFKAETTIENTTVSIVMNHLSDPELAQQWVYGLEDLQAAAPPESESILESDADEQGTATFIDEAGSIEMTNECLFASDDTLTTRTSNQYSDTFSTWQLTQQGNDVLVRQLMLGTHKGLGRFEGIFRKKEAQSSIEIDLTRLKSFIETGRIPDNLVPGSLTDSNESEIEPGNDDVGDTDSPDPTNNK